MHAPPDPGPPKHVGLSIDIVSGASLMIKPGGPTTFEAPAGRKIGVLGGTTTEEALRNSLASHKMKADVVVVKSHPEGLQLLAAGQVAAYFGDRTILQFMQRDDKVAAGLLLANDYLTFEPYALGVPHGDDPFRLAVDTALSRLYRSGDIQPTKGFPPVFLACSYTDRQDISEGLAEAYLRFKRAGVPAELHIYSTGGHGFGLRASNTKPVGAWSRAWMSG